MDCCNNPSLMEHRTDGVIDGILCTACGKMEWVEKEVELRDLYKWMD